MQILSLEVTDFYGTLDNDGNSVFTQIFALYFGGDWQPQVLGLFDITAGGVTLPALGSAMGPDAIGSTYYASAFAPRIESRQAGFASVTVQFKNSNTYEMLAGLRDTVAWEDAQQTREICFDFNKKALLTTARQLFAQNASVAFGLRGCTITGVRSNKIMPPVSDWKIVNGGPVTIDGISVAAGQAWLTSTRCETTYVQGVKKYLHNWSIVFRKSHDLEVPNMGTMELDPSTNKQIPIFRRGQPVTQPWPLDDNGVAYSAGYTADDIKKLTFDITEDFDFSQFGWKF